MQRTLLENVLNFFQLNSQGSMQSSTLQIHVPKNDPDMSYKGNFDWDVGNLFFRSSDSTFDTAGK